MFIKLAFTVRNRARELVELLSDVEKIRSERRKAKTNRNKYTGVGSDGLTLGVESSGGRYGGFGGDSLGSSFNGSYGNGGSLLDIDETQLSYSQITTQVVAAPALVAEARLSATIAANMMNTTLETMKSPTRQQDRIQAVIPQKSHLHHPLQLQHHNLKLTFWAVSMILLQLPLPLALSVIWPETRRFLALMVRSCNFL